MSPLQMAPMEDVLGPLQLDTWAHYPGYDSESESEASENKEEDKVDGQRLKDILDVLGDRSLEAPRIEFEAPKPQAKSKDKDASKREPLSFIDRFNQRRMSSSLPPQFLFRPAGGGSATFRLEHVAAPIVRETCFANGLLPVPNNDFCVMWSGPSMKDAGYKDLHEYQRVNHFPGGCELTRKDCMYKNLVEMANTFGTDTFDFIPETFVLPEQSEAFMDTYRQTGGLWIYKPHNAACGRGIFIFRDYTREKISMKEPAVICRYLDNPLLIQGLKFDLRVYVVVTQYEPLRAYIYREGLARFASAPYSTEDEHLSDVYRQLTNYSINKYASNFCENAEIKSDNYGHKWSLSALNKHLRCVGVDVNFMWSRIMDLICKTLLAVEPLVAERTRNAVDYSGVCFEVYGFDVLVDDTLKPWILEVNLSPSMQADSPLDWQVKSSLLTDSFNLIGVCRPDYRMVRASREKARMMQARAAQKRFLLERGSFTGLHITPKDVNQGSKAERHKISRIGTKSMVSNSPVQLTNLNEPQLKMLARSLQEFERVNNFIQLYPTRKTVERYAPITLSRTKECRTPSQLLASVLLGPPPVKPTLEAEMRKLLSSPASPTKPAARTPVCEASSRPNTAGDTQLQEEHGRVDDSPEEQLRSAGEQSHSASEAAERYMQLDEREHQRDVEERQEQAEKGNERKGREGRRENRTKRPKLLDIPRRKVREKVEKETFTEVSRNELAVEQEVAPDSLEPEEHFLRERPEEIINEMDNVQGIEDDPNAMVDGKADMEDSQRGESEAVEETTSCSRSESEQSDQAGPVVAEFRKAPEKEADKQDALQALRCLDADDCWRLALMEYLSRVNRACAGLNSKEKAKLARSSAYARLSTFTHRVRAIRAAWLTECVRPAPPSSDDSDLDSGDLWEEIRAVCRSTLSAIADEAWSLLETASEGTPGTPLTTASPSAKRVVDRRVRDVAKHLPPEFLQSAMGRQVLELLPLLCTSDLEDVLQSPRCVEQFDMLPELFASADEPPSRGGVRGNRPSSHLMRLTYSPLTELLQVRGSNPFRKNATYLPSLSAHPMTMESESPMVEHSATWSNSPQAKMRRSHSSGEVSFARRHSCAGTGPSGGAAFDVHNATQMAAVNGGLKKRSDSLSGQNFGYMTYSNSWTG